MPGYFSSTIDYNELLGSSEHEVSNDKPTSRRKFLVGWNDAIKFAEELTGRIKVSSGWVLVYPPKFDPQRAGLVCTKCRVSGLGACSTDASGLIAYHMGRVEADFELVETTNEKDKNKPTPDSITIVTEKSTGNVQAITVPGDKLKWKGGSRDGKPVGDDAVAAILVPGKSISYDIQYWFNPPQDLLDESYGKLNSGAVTILGKTYKKETLMLMSVSLQRQYTTDGISAWQASIAMNWRKQTWQTLYSPDDQKWLRVQSSSGKPPCETTSFEQLFPRGFI